MDRQNYEEPIIGLQWSDECLLGYDPIDEIHEECVNLIEAMLSAEDSALPNLLDAFFVHVQDHFKQENRWMIDSELPGRECHMDEHAAVLRSVTQVQEEVRKGNFKLCRELAQALEQWFPRHATHMDSALVHWLCKKRFDGKPIVIRRNIG